MNSHGSPFESGGRVSVEGGCRGSRGPGDYDLRLSLPTLFFGDAVLSRLLTHALPRPGNPRILDGVYAVVCTGIRRCGAPLPPGRSACDPSRFRWGSPWPSPSWRQQAELAAWSPRAPSRRKLRLRRRGSRRRRRLRRTDRVLRAGPDPPSPTPPPRSTWEVAAGRRSAATATSPLRSASTRRPQTCPPAGGRGWCASPCTSGAASTASSSAVPSPSVPRPSPLRVRRVGAWRGDPRHPGPSPLPRSPYDGLLGPSARASRRIRGRTCRTNIAAQGGGFVYTSLLTAQESGLTLDRVISDIPVDPASITIYVLVAVSVFVIWRGSRNSGRSGDTSTGPGLPTGGAPGTPGRRGTIPPAAVRRDRPHRTRPRSARSRRDSRGRA